MNWADWVIVGILVISCAMSVMRGFIKEALSLVIWIVAMVAANAFGHQIEPFLGDSIATPSLRAMTAFGLVFVGVLILGAVLNFAIGLLIKATGLSGTDRLLGGLFGAVRGVFIIMIFLIYIPNYLPVKSDPWYQQSQLIPFFQPYTATVSDVLGKLSHWVFELVAPSKKTEV